jgi:ATP-dependent Clp protease ATP-binding subunit ClpC
MFERYTEAGRRAVFFARALASERGCTTIETEHLLLGVSRADRPLLHRLGQRASFVEESMLKEIDRLSPPHPEQVDTSVDMRLSADAKKALTTASKEATRSVTPAHLLLGLFRAPGVASAVLRTLGVTEDMLRDELQEQERELEN